LTPPAVVATPPPMIASPASSSPGDCSPDQLRAPCQSMEFQPVVVRKDMALNSPPQVADGAFFSDR
jgi:hypothetical protein